MKDTSRCYPNTIADSSRASSQVPQSSQGNRRLPFPSTGPASPHNYILVMCLVVWAVTPETRMGGRCSWCLGKGWLTTYDLPGVYINTRIKHASPLNLFLSFLHFSPCICRCIPSFSRGSPLTAHLSFWGWCVHSECVGCLMWPSGRTHIRLAGFARVCDQSLKNIST